MRLEKSKHGEIPYEIYHDMKEIFYRSFRNDFDIVLNGGFFYKLTPKMQEELTSVLFHDFKSKFEDFFSGCNRVFVNQIIVSLSYKSFEQN